VKNQRLRKQASGLIGVIATFLIFIVPLLFISSQASKTSREAASLSFSWPEEFAFWENLVEVLTFRDFTLMRAFWNSTVLTVSSVVVVVVLGSLIAYVIQRRPSRFTRVLNGFVLAGLIVPPAVVPTVFVMQQLGLFKTLHGLVLIEVAFNISLVILLFRGFIATIPRDLDEAAIIDGAGPLRLFFQIIFPLLRGVTITAVILVSLAVFNDFQNPLYFLPGAENVTVQLTLFNFQSQFVTKFNLLFMNILLITIPMLVLFIFFNKKIIAGMTAGAIKG